MKRRILTVIFAGMLLFQGYSQVAAEEIVTVVQQNMAENQNTFEGSGIRDRRSAESVKLLNGQKYVPLQTAEENVEINAVNFPDEIFREYVKTFDKDGSGILEVKEIENVKKVSVADKKIKDLKGIEKFTALTELYCYSNELSSLDVSGNPELEFLNCSSNKLVSLDVSRNQKLAFLYCRYNSIESLDVSRNPELKELYCNNNQLTSLISGNPALREISCQKNKFVSLDISKNPALTVLICSDNQLVSLDVAQNSQLTYLLCENNQLKKLDVSRNPALTYLHCGGNQLSSLDVSKNTSLSYLHCGKNQLSSLDISANSRLVVLDCPSNQLKNLDISRNPLLTDLYCTENQLNGLNLDGNPVLTRVAYDRINPVSRQKIETNVSEVTLEAGKSILKLEVNNEVGEAGVTSWKSSNTKIVEVSGDGKLMAQKKTGMATVTVSMENGQTEMVKVIVKKSGSGSSNSSKLPVSLTLKKGASVTLEPMISSSGSMVCKSSNEKVASVSGRRSVKVKGKKIGKTKITVKAGKMKYTVAVTVKN